MRQLSMFNRDNTGLFRFVVAPPHDEKNCILWVEMQNKHSINYCSCMKARTKISVDFSCDRDFLLMAKFLGCHNFYTGFLTVMTGIPGDENTAFVYLCYPEDLCVTIP